MKRLLTQKLIEWKTQKQRKPILLDGARQTGKTFLIEHCFGKEHFKKVHKLDFLEEPSLADIFIENLKPKDVITRIELTLGVEIDLKSDLLFLMKLVKANLRLTHSNFLQKACRIYTFALPAPILAYSTPFQ